MTSEYESFIEAMPEEWQLEEDSEDQVKTEIIEHKNLKRYIKDKLNDLAKVPPTTEEQ